MKEVEKVQMIFEQGREIAETHEEYMVVLLASIASSLAVIADKMKEEDDE